MGIPAIHSQPLLGGAGYGGNADDDGSSSSGELRGIASGPAKSPPPPRRRRSYGDVLAANGTGALRGRPRRRGDGDGGDEQQQQQAAGTLLRLHEAPGYVSFEDVIGDAAFRDLRHGEDGVISDPLVRATSRLYACEAVRPPRRRQRSPGPLGTRRGSAMHGVVKNYVHPFFGFIAGIFCCAIPS